MRIVKSHAKLPMVERGQALTILINGQTFTAYAGETIAAVLTAEGILSYRYAERKTAEPLPGFFCGMGVCYGCVVLVNGNLRRACLTMVEEGMEIVSGEW